MVRVRQVCGVVMAAALGAMALPARAAISVNVGNYTVGAGNAVVADLAVTNSDLAAASDIEGMVLTVQIDAGTGSVPAITGIDALTGTVWGGHVSAGNVFTPAGGNLPQYQSRDLFTDVPGDYVNANGTLAHVTINTVGAGLGTYAIKVVGTKVSGRDSTLLNGVGTALPVTFADGVLTVAAYGDATLDGKVDAFDLNALAANWQVPSGATWAMGDFTGDGKVDAFDLNVLAANWQFGVGGSLQAAMAEFPQFAGVSVPEPGSLAVMILGLGMLGRRACGFTQRR